MSRSWAKTGQAERDEDPLCAELVCLLVVPKLKSMEKPERRERAEYDCHWASWCGIELEIRYCPCWFSMPEDDFVTQHIEIRSQDKRLLPITDTGYRSHFMNGVNALIEFDNDPVTFVLWWLDEAAKDPTWERKSDEDRQGSLF